MNEVQKEMSIIDHLRDLRKFLLHSVAGVFIAAIFVAFNINFVFDKIIMAPTQVNFYTYRVLCKLSSDLCVDKVPLNIMNIDMTGQFTAHIWTSVTFGIILAFPYILYDLWKFIKPALYESERKTGVVFISVSSFLFLIGVLFGYFLITPLSVNFFARYKVSDMINNQIKMSSYISFVRSTVLANGVVFELPVIIYFLAKGGIVTSDFMKQNRKYAVIIVLALAAMITPPDVVSQIIVAIPLLILYEFSIFIAKTVGDKKSKELFIKN